MKIKLAVLERDESYRKRIVSILSTRFAETLELYSFTGLEVAISMLDNAKIDVLLADDSFSVDVGQLPRRCAFAYFVESSDIETLNGQPVVFKYQKIDLIYKQILNLYAETSGEVSGLRMGSGDCKIIVFGAASGGTGSSSMAAACAIHFSEQGHRVLYLNLEQFGDAGVFFSADGQYDMSDVVFTVKSKKANLALKLESCVRRDPCGVYFFARPKIALDLMELGADEKTQIVSELSSAGAYDRIIIDCDFSLSKDDMALYQQAHAIVLVGDGSEVSNEKTVQAYHALEIMEQNVDAPIRYRMRLIYNKFSNKTCELLPDIGLESLGGIPRFEHAKTADVVKRLIGMGDLFDRIV